MKEDFVSLKLAKKLKERGFMYSTETIYFEDGGIGIYTGCNKTLDSNLFPRPTIPQVLKWLREEKKIYIDIPSFPTYANKDRVAFAVIVKHGSDGYSMKEYESSQSYSKWDETALVGIEYALDNLI